MANWSGVYTVPDGQKKIVKLAVETSMRKQSIGRRLMAGAEKHGRDIGWTLVEIAIWNFRSDLLKYYRNLGYAEKTAAIGTPKPPVRCIQLCHFIIMSKQLA